MAAAGRQAGWLREAPLIQSELERLWNACVLDARHECKQVVAMVPTLSFVPHPTGFLPCACRMLFGWKAADQLKTQTLSYKPTTSQWKRYFDT